ncbi:MAG: hypothetical protein PHZ19_11510 [Candidatus Thermoplasmatota archaeon]|nr:hypothetical protein [Candidatus Thermoplasmatota archaeon]
MRQSSMEGPDDEPGADYIGWRIAHVQDEPEIKTGDQALRRAFDVGRRMTRLPLNAKRIVLPLAVTGDQIRGSAAMLMRRGHVVAVLGGRGVGTHGKKFRVTNVQHNVDQMQTVIFGRRMIGPYG